MVYVTISTTRGLQNCNELEVRLVIMSTDIKHGNVPNNNAHFVHIPLHITKMPLR